MTPENLAKARGFYERALEIDPANVEALVGLGTVDANVAGNHMIDDRAPRYASAEQALTRALNLAPEHASAHAWLGDVKIMTKRQAQGIAECERALALDRNLTWAHSVIGIGKFSSGRGEETEAHIQEALRLSPRDTYVNIWMYVRAIAKILAGNDEAGVELCRQSPTSIPTLILPCISIWPQP